MTAMQTALCELTGLRELLAELMFEHILDPHHSHLCQTCKRAFELGIKPTPERSDQGLMCDIQREENERGDGYFGAFGPLKAGAR